MSSPSVLSTPPDAPVHPGLVGPGWPEHWRPDAEQIRHRRLLPARPGQRADFPDWLPPTLTQRLRRDGITSLWSHQRQAAEAVRAGRHTVIATGTASGKSLAYLMPVIAATSPQSLPPGRAVTSRELLAVAAARGRRTALYLAPTKALAHDQLRVARGLDQPGWRVGALDGDSSDSERDFAREHAHFVVSNPDMVHASVLPRHRHWAPLLRSLQVIVVDECHRYRGVFGAHVAAVLRRLLRLCAAHGARPVVVFASATVAEPDQLAGRLIGVDPADIAVVDHDGSPHGPVSVVLWDPTGHLDDEAADLLAELVDADRQTIAFVPSRVRSELMAGRARERLTSSRQIESYRSGYLAYDRRALERRLQDRSLHAVAATNALELGVDIAGLDAVLLAGYPGTRAALWQQAGRAGRRGSEALVVLLARQDPLDAYLFEHPELIFDHGCEATVLHPENPHVLAPHLAAAAQEAPLTEADERWFGPTMVSLCDQLTGQGVLRRRDGGAPGSPRGWFWPHPERAVDSINLRSAGGRPVDIVDQDTGRVVGTVDQAAADRTVHSGAMYLHQGEQWRVETWEPGEQAALVSRDHPAYYTQPESSHDVRIMAVEDKRDFFGGTLFVGEVQVSTQVLGYLRRDRVTNRVWDRTPLTFPERTLRTRGVWWTLPREVETALDWSAITLGSAAHAAEHTAIGLLPVFAPCDRWDIGGLSTAQHPDTGLCTVFVHDGHPGGAGFADHGFGVAELWWQATLTRLLRCDCDAGCPSCVMSPKCGNANQSLDKSAAGELLLALGLSPEHRPHPRSADPA